MGDITPPAPATLVLPPGTLWHRMVAQTKLALQCGALQPIPTAYELVPSEGMDFIVRVISQLARKDAAAQQQRQNAAMGKPTDPFLPYEPDLFVTHISPTHLALLNKFNVVNHHLLLVTRAFEAQTTWLTQSDFEALWACMFEVDGFAFYNAGPVAGASQSHKHLQLLPLPLAPVGPAIPLASCLTAASLKDPVNTLAGLPFLHAIAPLSPGLDPPFPDCGPTDAGLLSPAADSSGLVPRGQSRSSPTGRHLQSAGDQAMDVDCPALPGEFPRHPGQCPWLCRFPAGPHRRATPAVKNHWPHDRVEACRRYGLNT